MAERLSTAEICTLRPNELAGTMEYVKILNKVTQKIYKLQSLVPAENRNVQLSISAEDCNDDIQYPLNIANFKNLRLN